MCMVFACVRVHMRAATYHIQGSVLIRRPTGDGARSPPGTPRDHLAPSRLYHVPLSYVTTNYVVLTTWY